jgi:hypothetical protein
MGLSLSSGFFTTFSFSVVALSLDRPAPIDNQHQAASAGRETTHKPVQSEPARGGDDRRHILVFGGAPCRLRTMMQSCASAARLFGGRAHSLPGRCAMGAGHRPPRIVWHCLTPRRINAEPVFDCSFSCLDQISSRCRTQHCAGRHLAGRHEAPQGDQQLARQGDDHGLAQARLGAFRARLEPFRQGAGFWNMSQRHASWTMPRRTRALPALASRFSRRLLPLSSGAPVMPP